MESGAKKSSHKGGYKDVLMITSSFLINHSIKYLGMTYCVVWGEVS